MVDCGELGSGGVELRVEGSLAVLAATTTGMGKS